MVIRTAVVILILCAIAPAQTLSSPDGQVRISFSGAPLTYSVSYRGKAVIARSAMGLEFAGQPPLGPNAAIADSQPGKISETYSVPAGKASTIRNECNTLTIEAHDGA